MQKIIITANEAGQRLDKFLRKLLPNIALGQIYKLLRTKKIKVNNKKAQPNLILALHDCLEIFPHLTTDEPKKQLLFSGGEKIQVVYEDVNILLLNKPAGTLTHPAQATDRETLIQQALSYLITKGEYKPEQELTFTPATANRLDRNTSGLVLVAKNFSTLQAVNEMIRTNAIQKYYQCLVKGVLKRKEEIHGFLWKDEQTNKVQITPQQQKESKAIHTIYQPLSNNDHYTLLEVELITGRTHQIRAHLAYQHYPIVGDNKYGLPKTNEYFKKYFHLQHQFLHAYKLKFQHAPPNLDYLAGKTFFTPLPPHLEKIKQELFI